MTEDTGKSKEKKQAEQSKKIRQIVITIVIVFVGLGVLSAYNSEENGFAAFGDAISPLIFMAIFVVPAILSKKKKKQGTQKGTLWDAFDEIAKTVRAAQTQPVKQKTFDRKTVRQEAATVTTMKSHEQKLRHRQQQPAVDQNMVRNIIAVVGVLTLLLIGAVLVFLI